MSDPDGPDRRCPYCDRAGCFHDLDAHLALKPSTGSDCAECVAAEALPVVWPAGVAS